MSEGRYTVDAVRGWRFDNAHAVLSTMGRKSAEITAEANATARDYDASTDFWNASGGQAARNLSAMHQEDLLRSAAVVIRVAEVAGDNLDQMQGYVDVLNDTVNAINGSEFDLAYTPDGGVYSRRSNIEWAEEWGWRAAYKFGQKNTAVGIFTGRLRSALAQVESIDQSSGESVRSILEKLTDSVKSGAVPQPDDPRLRDILSRYKTSPTGQASLWPDGTTLALIRQVMPGFNPRLMTPEEVQMMVNLLGSNRGLHKVKTLFDAMSRADQAAESRFGKKGQDDGHGDAFRHAYWNALMTREFGADWTKQYATAHEGLGGNPANREAMDLFNNEVGRSVALAHPDASPDELAALIANEVDDGRTLIIGADKTITWSDQLRDGSTGQPGTVGIPSPAAGN